MSTRYALRKHSLIHCSLFALLLLAFLLVGCGKGGASTSTGAGSTAGSSPTAAPTSIKGYGSVNGCPSDTVITNQPTNANVIVQPSDVNTTITAHNGNVVEVRLPFGHKWTGPLASPTILQLQSPSGYAWKPNNACIWRFVAHGTGSAQLNFTNQPLCKKGQMCPMFIMAVSFKITIQ